MPTNISPCSALRPPSVCLSSCKYRGWRGASGRDVFVFGPCVVSARGSISLSPVSSVPRPASSRRYLWRPSVSHYGTVLLPSSVFTIHKGFRSRISSYRLQVVHSSMLPVSKWVVHFFVHVFLINWSWHASPPLAPRPRPNEFKVDKNHFICFCNYKSSFAFYCSFVKHIIFFSW